MKDNKCRCFELKLFNLLTKLSCVSSEIKQFDWLMEYYYLAVAKIQFQQFLSLDICITQ